MNVNVLNCDEARSHVMMQYLSEVPLKVIYTVLAAIVFMGLFIHEVRADFSNYAVVNGKARTFTVFSADNVQVLSSPIQIGRGGVGAKRSMSDHVTPVGDFVVDVLLSSNPSSNSVESTLREKYRNDHRFRKYFEPEDGRGLTLLFDEMNALDFDSDAIPDNSYGVAYIGLSSKRSITGPKMHLYRGLPYWFSIALHGTPRDSDFGRGTSGGCVHLPRLVLERITTEGLLRVGSRVSIISGS